MRSIRYYLYKKANKSNTPESWNLFKENRNKVKKMLNSAKENYVKNKLEELESNQLDSDIFYNKTYMRVLRKLQKLQNRALKLCLGKDARYNTDLLHFEASLPKLENRRKSHILNFAFHRAHNDQYIRHFDRDLRAGDAPFLYEPFSRCESFKRSIVSQCATHWNALPVNERNIQEYDSFKFKQKQKIIPTIHNI